MEVQKHPLMFCEVVPLPNRKCNKTGWASFFHLSLRWSKWQLKTKCMQNIFFFVFVIQKQVFEKNLRNRCLRIAWDTGVWKLLGNGFLDSFGKRVSWNQLSGKQMSFTLSKLMSLGFTVQSLGETLLFGSRNKCQVMVPCIVKPKQISLC